jgi:imidazoleglycerol-phosphate dehydratase
LDTFYTMMAQEAHMTLIIDCQGDVWVDDHHTAEDVSIAIGQCLTQALGDKAGLNRMWVGEASDGNNNYNNNNNDHEAFVRVTMDLSNRPCFVHNLHETLGRQEFIDETMASVVNNDDNDIDKNVGATATNSNKECRLTCEMLVHSLDSLVMNGRMTVHVMVMLEKEEGAIAKTIIGQDHDHQIYHHDDSSSADNNNNNNNNNNINTTVSVVDVVLGTAKAFGRALRVCAMVDQRRAGTTASSKGTLSA